MPHLLSPRTQIKNIYGVFFVLLFAALGTHLLFGTNALTPNVSAALAPPTIPGSGGAYLGAWINPNGSANEIAQIPAFNASLGGRSVGILHDYMGFSDPFPTSNLNTITANGSIPLLDQHADTYTKITSGADDTTLTADADAAKSFGHPLFLRWGWEMNLSDAQKFGSASQFVAAWIHIHKLYIAQGADNVTFVWCPSAANDAAAYYPGDTYVGWICADAYDHAGTGAADFSTLFGSFYTEWATHDKPIMVGETGALATGNDQAAYIAGFDEDVASMPDVKAIVYFDSDTNYNWILGSAGVSAFTAANNSTTFSPYSPGSPPTPTPTPPPTPTPSPTPAPSSSSSSSSSATPSSVATATPVSTSPLEVTKNTLLQASPAKTASQIVKADYYLNSTLLATVTRSPFTYSLNPKNYRNGVYTLKTVTYYTAGNVITTSRQITIKNAFSLKQFELLARHDYVATTAILVVIVTLIVGFIFRNWLILRIRSKLPFHPANTAGVITSDGPPPADSGAHPSFDQPEEVDKPAPPKD